MPKIKRYLEIGADCIAFHETDFGGNTPPNEVHYCDCTGIGRETWNPLVPHEDFPTLDAWKSEHKDCGYRRQIFVDVTKRKDAKLGMSYNEATDTFSEKKS